MHSIDALGHFINGLIDCVFKSLEMPEMDSLNSIISSNYFKL